MRISASVRNVFMLLAIAAPVLVNPQLRAQFQQPTDDELKMTEDPKAPGAAAVYLNIEEVTDDSYHFHSVYARIKVLQEKGKELATVEVPYERHETKVDDIEARTIHADGTVIPLNGKPDDLLIVKTGDKQFGRKVFTLPSVEVGSILEYSYRIRYDDDSFSSPFWEIQQPYYVHKAHYGFTPFKAFMRGTLNHTSSFLLDEHGDVVNSLIWWHILPPGADVKTDMQGRYSLDVADIPAMPKEEWMPPMQNFRYKVLFYYKAAESTEEFWAVAIKRWSKEVDRFAEQSGTIRDAVNGIVAPGDGDAVKAKKIYKAVQALDNTDFSRKKNESELKQLKQKAAKRAEDTWTQKSGSGEDLTLLYLAMARAAGLKANAMKVVDRENGIFDPSYLSMNQLDDMIVVLQLDGKEVSLDPGEKMCPFGALHWRHSNAGGFVQFSDGKAPKTTPSQAYPDNKLTRMADVSLGENGSIKGSMTFVVTGQEALHWRQESLRYDADEVKKRFDRWIEGMVPDGIAAHLDHFVGMDDPETNLVAQIKAEGTLGTATGKRLMLPGFLFETRARHPFVDQAKREEPVDMHYGEQVNDQVTYRLPAGLAVEGAPQDGKISWPMHAILITKTVPSPDRIVVARSMARAFTFALASEYQDLRGFYQKVSASDQQQLVLTASAAAKGN
jgi:hypothetical protein